LTHSACGKCDMRLLHQERNQLFAHWGGTEANDGACRRANYDIGADSVGTAGCFVEGFRN